MTAKIDGTNGLLQQYDYQVLTTGFSYTFAAGTTTLIANPAGALATGTVTMPAAPADGMTITVASTQPIAALTVNANTGQTINNGGALGLAAGGSLTYVYRLANTAWQPFNAGVPIGVGQTWQNVTASRASATTYTNTTGRPIYVTYGWAGGFYTAFLIDGVATANTASSSNIGGYYVVPAGSTYRINASGGGSLAAWSELR